MNNYSKAKLVEIGFLEVAHWRLEEDRLGYGLAPSVPESETICRFPNVLYAFTSNEEVLYIGKTTKSVRQRFTGYCNPGQSQATNQKCHSELKRLLRQNREVAILVFSGERLLRYDVFEVNLAAGLEDSLIKMFRPRWNGKLSTGSIVSESAENETQAVTTKTAPTEPEHQRINATRTFKVKLGKTYYRLGFINAGRQISDALGANGAPMLIRLGCLGHEGVKTKIDRRANSNGTPRIYGGVEVARWFQGNFREGDTVNAIVVSPNEILFETQHSINAAAER